MTSRALLLSPKKNFALFLVVSPGRALVAQITRTLLFCATRGALSSLRRACHLTWEAPCLTAPFLNRRARSHHDGEGAEAQAFDTGGVLITPPKKTDPGKAQEGGEGVPSNLRARILHVVGTIHHLHIAQHKCEAGLAFIGENASSRRLVQASRRRTPCLQALCSSRQPPGKLAALRTIPRRPRWR